MLEGVSADGQISQTERCVWSLYLQEVINYLSKINVTRRV